VEIEQGQLVDTAPAQRAIETNRDRFLIIKENKLTNYLAQIA
jgi:hypothetical protein